MEWWVRCGNCFSSTAPITLTTIFLTSCGHFVCNDCLAKAPIPKPAQSGYCYDCKKLCSVVNLNQGEKLSSDVAFYFKDPSALLQKIVEVDNFQKLHRRRRVEGRIRKKLIEDIIAAKLHREKTEKYLPLLEQIYNTLCSKYGIQPTAVKRIDFSPDEIGAFLGELVELDRQQSQMHAQMPGPVVAGQDFVMDVDRRTPSQSGRITPMQQGSSPRSTIGIMSNKSVGAQNSQLFRAHVQKEMRGTNGTPYSARTTPTAGSSCSKPSPLLCSTRSTPQNLPPQPPQIRAPLLKPYVPTALQTPPIRNSPQARLQHGTSSISPHQFTAHPPSLQLRARPLITTPVPVSLRPPLPMSSRPPISTSLRPPMSTSMRPPMSTSMRPPMSTSLRPPMSTSSRSALPMSLKPMNSRPPVGLLNRSGR